MAGVVHLHVGTPKSGTTYLQRTLARHRGVLRTHGYLYPGDRSSHFLAALDVRGTRFRGYADPGADGAWGRLADEIEAWDGPALVSHEILGRAGRATIRRMVDSFPGREVRVVVTCRDLGRLVPAAYQEQVKNGNVQEYDDFLAGVVDAWTGLDTVARPFWRAHNLVALLRRWESVVGAGRLVLVTVPEPDAPPGALWDRFAEAVGLPAFDRVADGRSHNTSLGSAETELLRRLVRRLPDDLDWPRHARLVKKRFAERELVAHRVAGPLAVPVARREALEVIAAEMIAGLRDGGYRIVGDLDDLRPRFGAAPAVDPGEVTDTELLDLALELLAPQVLREASRPARQPARRARSVPAALRELGRALAATMRPRRRRSG